MLLRRLHYDRLTGSGPGIDVQASNGSDVAPMADCGLCSSAGRPEAAVPQVSRSGDVLLRPERVSAGDSYASSS